MHVIHALSSCFCVDLNSFARKAINQVSIVIRSAVFILNREKHIFNQYRDSFFQNNNLIMADSVTSNVFRIISLIRLIVTFLPDAFLNYRLKNTSNLSNIAVILWILGGEVSLVYLVWSKELSITSVVYGIVTIMTISIGFQLGFYRKENENRAIGKSLEFLFNSSLLLTCSVIIAFAMFHIFDLTESNPWLVKTICIVLVTVVHGVGFICELVGRNSTLIEEEKAEGLIHVTHRYELEKEIPFASLRRPMLKSDEQLKVSLQSHFDLHLVHPKESDQSLVKSDPI